jgi:hypothetical protein
MDFLEHASDAHQMVAEDLFGNVEQLEDALIAHRVVDIRAILASLHNIPVAKYGKLLRSVSVLNVKTLADLVDSQLTLPQCIEDRDSQGVGQGLEKFRFEIAELPSHPDLRSISWRLNPSKSGRLNCVFVQLRIRNYLHRIKTSVNRPLGIG